MQACKQNATANDRPRKSLEKIDSDYKMERGSENKAGYEEFFLPPSYYKTLPSCDQFHLKHFYTRGEGTAKKSSAVEPVAPRTFAQEYGNKN